MTTQSRVPLRAGLVCAALTLGGLAQARAPAVAAANWRIDPARTHIAFAIDAVGYPRTHGQFRQFAGRISVDFEHPERSSVSFQVQSQSVDVGSASFDDYLRSDAFLNSTRFPSRDICVLAPYRGRRIATRLLDALSERRCPAHPLEHARGKSHRAGRLRACRVHAV